MSDSLTPSFSSFKEPISLCILRYFDLAISYQDVKVQSGKKLSLTIVGVVCKDDTSRHES